MPQDLIDQRRTLALMYKNAADILPRSLVEEIQKYVQGRKFTSRSSPTNTSAGENGTEPSIGSTSAIRKSGKNTAQDPRWRH